MTRSSETSRADSLCSIIREAGVILSRHFHQELYWKKRKADGSFVTQADYESHHFIKEKLENLYPSLPVVSEEGSNLHTDTALPESYFLLDPMDGTRQFLHSHKDFCISLALIEQGEPIMGLLYQPITETLWYGNVKEHSAWRQVAAKQRENLSFLATPTSCFEDRGLHLLCGLQSNLTKAVLSHRIGCKISGFSKIGSAIKFARLAEGDGEAIFRFHPVFQWDIAAGHALLRVVGAELYTIVLSENGHVLDYRPMRYGLGDNLWEATPFACASRKIFEFLKTKRQSVDLTIRQV